MPSVIIVGSGIGGIALSIRLAKKKGYDVHIYEANDFSGGKLSQFNLGGYRFDAGPSLFTMPQYVDELFSLCGETSTDFFEYEQLETVCHYFWEDGTRLKAYSNFDAFAQEVKQVFDIDKKALQNFFDENRMKYELTGRIFLERSLHKFTSWFRKDVGKALFHIPQLDIFKTMHQVNQKKLKHPKLVQFFDRFATYNGSNPYEASGILNIIPHFEHHFGAYFPKGGMVSITSSLVDLALRQGVNFHFGKKVEKIEVKNHKVSGILLNGEFISADIVASNVDVYPTYKKLLPNEKHPTRILNEERSSSALIFYWGIQKQFPELILHNILFSKDYEKEFSCLSEGKIYDDPTVYINISSKHQKSDAPQGCENWFTMINVPFNKGQYSEEVIQEAKKNILKKIKRSLGVDIEPFIACEDVLDPISIESRTGSFAGALYGTASNDRMAAFNRHPNFSRRIKNLYFCGGSVHPGGGIPLCLLSAKIVDELISLSCE